MPKLYHYVHCPFCVRVRMALGLLDFKYESVVVSYDDEKTPNDLCGKKMLPIMDLGEGPMNESLDIMKKADVDNKLKWELLTEEKLTFINDLLSKIGGPVHNLCMPYWIWTPEFNNESRSYFLAKKEQKRGPFNLLVQNKKEHLKDLLPVLKEVERRLVPYFEGNEFSVKDILIASHLWGLYILPEFQFPPKLHEYLQRVKMLCKFDYHEDFWK